MPKRERLVMVGNGMAGMAFVEKLVDLAPDRHSIAVFGDEPHPNYNRILLSSALSGEADWGDLTIQSLEWYDQHGVELRTALRVPVHERLAGFCSAYPGNR